MCDSMQYKEISLYYQMFWSKNHWGAGQWCITAPTTWDITIPIAWEGVHHGGDSLPHHLIQILVTPLTMNTLSIIQLSRSLRKNA